ncbi:unnamed protein product [Meganyctiphanes norvegica]|uniref:Uncharacterized protein n=1 Tax=Meganyctiphanes norvegica TaxID=48144 RepID=A0AAV2R8X7_MEGNR
MGYSRSDKRGCDIYFYRRHIGGLLVWHWALTFWWDDGYKETYEADKRGDYLRMDWYEGKPDPSHDWDLWNSYRCNNCSPAEVTRTAKGLDCVDRTYSWMYSNCHDFAKALASKFGVSLPPGIAKVVRTIGTLGLDNFLNH